MTNLVKFWRSLLNITTPKGGGFNIYNKFKPNLIDIGKVYNNFIAINKSTKTGLKITYPDIPLDTLLWQTETYFNNEYVVFSDSGFKSKETYDTLTFVIESYNSSGIPIIDGRDVQNFVDEYETIYGIENEDYDNEYFWCSFANVDSIYSDHVSIVMTSVYVVDYVGILPPGWNPNEFLDYTCMQAAYPGECDETHWWGANIEYEKKYRFGPIAHDPDYIYVFHSFLPVFYDSPGVNGRLWTGTSIHNIISTAGDDPLNTYLLSTKDLIDDYNPMGANSMYLGNVDVYGMDAEPFYGTSAAHYIVVYWFQKVYVGHSGE